MNLDTIIARPRTSVPSPHGTAIPAGSTLRTRATFLLGTFGLFWLFGILPSACRTTCPERTAEPAPVTVTVTAGWSKHELLAAMHTVADWQLAHPSNHPIYHWPRAALYAGLMALAKVSPDRRYFESMRRMGQSIGHQLGPRPGHADDHAVAQTYALLYEEDPDERLLGPTRKRFDEMLALPFDASLEWDEDVHNREWAWCDALFMSPPAMAYVARVTGDERYLELMNRLWWKTTNYLFDPDEKLYFRDSRYFDKHEPNGRKVFWSRGNGWVLGGLVRVLSSLPASHPERPRYERLLVDMATRLAALQGSDGFWRASLLDPDSVPNPEASGTGFFVYGMAAGVNLGILDPAVFHPAIEKGWKALISAVQSDGALGFVQEIGHKPGSATATSHEDYGTGAFLLAGSEILKMHLSAAAGGVSVTLGNPAELSRHTSSVDIPWGKLTSLGIKPESVAAGGIVVRDRLRNELLPFQVYDADGDSQPDALVIQPSFYAGETRVFEIKPSPEPFSPPVYYPAFGRHAPERKDDITWENDRTGFRVYGPALEATGEISSGIDVWSKRVRHPIIDAWYAKDDYHVDHGEGLDFYKVGPSRGCGGLAIVDGEQFATSRNWTRFRQLANGPLRVAFQLSYAAWGPQGTPFEETKIISLDRGSHLNRIIVSLKPQTGAATSSITVAAGIVKREGDGQAFVSPDGRALSYWEPETENGTTGCAVIFPGDAHTAPRETADHHWLTAEVPVSRTFTYLAGATWSRGADFRSAQSWAVHVTAQARALQAPITIE